MLKLIAVFILTAYAEEYDYETFLAASNKAVAAEEAKIVAEIIGLGRYFLVYLKHKY